MRPTWLLAIDEAIELDPDLVVIAVGCNDVIHSTPTRRFAATLDSVIARLHRAEIVVAVANIGDLGTIARLVWPLSILVSVRSSSIRRAIEGVAARRDRVVLLDVTASNAGFRDRTRVRRGPVPSGGGWSCALGGRRPAGSGAGRRHGARRRSGRARVGVSRPSGLEGGLRVVR